MEFEKRGYFLKISNSLKTLPDLKSLSNLKINKLLDRLDKENRKFVDEFIKVGRGNERFGDLMSKEDELSVQYKMLSDTVHLVTTPKFKNLGF